MLGRMDKVEEMASEIDWFGIDFNEVWYAVVKLSVVGWLGEVYRLYFWEDYAGVSWAVSLDSPI